MAVITTNNNAVGNVSDGTKFVGGFAPTTGDTLATNTASDITMDASLDLGTGGATGTDAITMTGTSRLRFTSAAQVLRGGVTVNRGCRVDFAASTDIGWHMPSGSSYEFKTGTAGSGVQTMVSAASSWSAPVLLRKLSGAAGDTIRFLPDIFTAHVLTLNYVKFDGFGSSSTTAIACSGTSAAVNWSWSHVLLQSCGQFTCQLTSASLTFSMVGLDIRASLASTAISWVITTARTSGTRLIQKMTHYSTAAVLLTMSLRDFTYEDDRLYNGAIVATGSGSRDTVWQDGISVWGLGDPNATAIQSAYGNANHTFRRRGYYKANADQNNAHNVEEAAGGSVSPTIYEVCVFHGGDLAANDDDGIIPQSHAIIRRNIFCGNFGGVGIKNASGTTTHVYHNTFVTRSIIGHAYGIMYAEVTPNNVDAVGEVSDNIFAVLGAQTTGDLSSGFQARTTSLHIPMTTGLLRRNAWWFTPAATASRALLLKNKTLGIVSYAGQSGATGSNIRVTSQTLGAGTSWPTLVVPSGSPFSSVQVGDLVVSTASVNKGSAYVSAVNSANSITVDASTANLVAGNFASGDAIYVQQKTWASGATMGSDADHGGEDVYADPGFIDPTRGLDTFDTSVGGPGTALHAIQQMVAVNGIAYDGTVTTYDSNYTPTAANTHVRYGFIPTNAALRNAYETVSTNHWIGAMEGVLPARAMVATSFLGLRPLTISRMARA